MNTRTIPASFFGAVLGICGMGQAWRRAAVLWQLPEFIGNAILLCGIAVWLLLLLRYIWQALQNRELVQAEFVHPVQGGATALLGVSTLLAALAILPFSRFLACVATAAGLSWHLAFSLWHTGRLWQGGRNGIDSVPTLYLPTVGGNFTAAAALGALGYPDWAWAFLGCGFFFWMAIESIIVQRLVQQAALPVAQRPLLGIQFAPPAVCAMAWLNIAPGSTDHWVLMLWGYGLFQLLLGLRMALWLGEQPFAPSYWAYTFGIASTATVAIKLAEAGVSVAQVLSLPIFIGANLFIGYLVVRSLLLMVRTDA